MVLCPYCDAEVQKGERFCGHCGKKLIVSKFFTEENKYWKWGSMIASLVFLIIAWGIGFSGIYYEFKFIFQGWLIAFPVIIYLIYIERTKKVKYALAWISLVIVLAVNALSGGLYPDEALILFILFCLFAIALDVIYVYKTK